MIPINFNYNDLNYYLAESTIGSRQQTRNGSSMSSSDTLFRTPQHASGMVENKGHGDRGDSDARLRNRRQLQQQQPSTIASSGFYPALNRPCHQKMKKFCNGVRVPVFEESDVEDDSKDDSNATVTCKKNKEMIWDGKFPSLRSDEISALMNLFRCAVCLDILVEVIMFTINVI